MAGKYDLKGNLQKPLYVGGNAELRSLYESGGGRIFHKIDFGPSGE